MAAAVFAAVDLAAVDFAAADFAAAVFAAVVFAAVVFAATVVLVAVVFFAAADLAAAVFAAADFAGVRVVVARAPAAGRAGTFFSIGPAAETGSMTMSVPVAAFSAAAFAVLGRFAGVRAAGAFFAAGVRGAEAFFAAAEDADARFDVAVRFPGVAFDSVVGSSAFSGRASGEAVTGSTVSTRADFPGVGRNIHPDNHPGAFPDVDPGYTVWTGSRNGNGRRETRCFPGSIASMNAARRSVRLVNRP